MIRPLTPADVPAAAALLRADAGRTGHGARALEILPLAAGATGEYEGAVALHEDVVGLALYGTIAGTTSTGAIHALVAPDAALARALLAHALAALRAAGARTAVAEMPDTPALRARRALLAAAGFAEVARVADYYRDGVDLAILALRLQT